MAALLACRKQGGRGRTHLHTDFFNLGGQRGNPDWGKDDDYAHPRLAAAMCSKASRARHNTPTTEVPQRCLADARARARPAHAMTAREAA
eukprot:3422879-Alexandrium_andersonii.AAC.1